ncbi:peptide chain release factor N(5)-glutamine methyltransferase [Formosa haliotis]|uniref:peptide chain release factor N(5)-glutamine methyltransferase n=1 Tax=Formosa haliotis TaxID=1555194 RepID=UPI0008243F02|nr:peptide chain release factor N(5)-glutamine methyltransferase [Formosa haliotis]
MRLKEIQHTFHKELDANYEPNEVDHFFFMICETWFNVTRLALALNPKRSINPEEYKKIHDALEALKAHKPIQYILKSTTFYGLEFQVSPSVLIPRPETEDLISWIIESYDALAKLRILDIGTGSGCIAISLAKHFKNAEVLAIDVSEDALQVAKQNADLNGVYITCIKADILNIDIENHPEFNEAFDVIVSNPPYVRQLEKPQMRANVLDYEPHLALFVDDQDPLKFYKAITELSKHNLVNQGELFFEINEFLGEDMIHLLEDHAFHEVELRQDLFKRNRMIKGKKHI